MYIFFLIFFFQKFLCIEIEFSLENIPKSVLYKTNDDSIYNNYYVYTYKKRNSNEDIKIIYQTGKISNEEKTFPILYNQDLSLYNNEFSNDDCSSDFISSFLFCKENLKHFFNGYLNIYKTLEDLYSKKKIQKKIFGQEYSTDKNKLKIYFGDVSSMSPKKYSYKCEINNYNEILLNFISLSSNDNNDNDKNNITNIEINSNVEINSAYNNIKGSYDLGEKIFSYILSLPSFKDKCSISKSKSISYEDEYIKLICDSDTNIYLLPNIVFSFGKNNQLQLILSPDMFFYKQYDAFGDKFFYISSIEFSKINKNWIIGRPLLNEANLIFNLDEKDKHIEFLYDTDKFFYKVNISTNSGLKKFIIIFFCFIGIGIIAFAIWFALFYLKRKKKNINLKYFMEDNVQSLNDI